MSVLLDSMGRRNRKHADRECAQCRTVFRPINAKSRYCSRPCAWANNGKHQTPKKEIWWMSQKGYVHGRIILEDGKRRTVKQHRYLMEQAIGRKLLPHEDVHHINGIKHDNRLENLEILDHSRHSRISNVGRYRAYGIKLNLSDEERENRRRRMSEQRRSGQISPPKEQAAMARKAT